MANRLWTFSTPVVLALTLSAGCGGGGESDPFIPPDTTAADTIPLDGRGGGVIAYTLQPGPGSGVHEIHAMNADGTGDRRIVDTSIGLNHHNWSPNGQKLAASGYLADATSIYVFDADGQNLTRLTTVPGVSDSEPHWSPDGSTIVFTRVYEEQNYRSEIWVMNADGSDQRWIGVEGFAASWSPDGSRFIYQSTLGQLTGIQSDIRTCSVDGSDVRNLTGTPSDESAPTLSPDGTQIAFVADYEGVVDLYIMDADGTDLRRLTQTAVADYAPRWSPDGSTIGFSSDSSGSGQFEVYLIGVDGANSRRVTFTRSPRTSINPVWRPTN